MADDAEGPHHAIKISLVGRIVSVTVDLEEFQITLRIEVEQESLPSFEVNATVPCSKKFMRTEHHWYTQLRKSRRLLAFKGAFIMVDGVIELQGPDITIVTGRDD